MKSNIVAPLALAALAVAAAMPGRASGAEILGGDNTVGNYRCMDAAGGSSADGTPVILYPCTRKQNQFWVHDAGTFVGIGGKCAIRKDGGIGLGTPIVLGPCSPQYNSPHYAWVHWLLAGGDITSARSDVGSGNELCIGVAGPLADSAHLVLTRCLPHFKWSIR